MLIDCKNGKGAQIISSVLVKGKRCDFSEWLEPEMCDRALEVTRGILKKIRTMELELDINAIEKENLEKKIKD